MKTPYVFISFSSKDLKYVRELMSALKTQGVNFWDYSEKIQEIELGLNISDAIKDQIDKSDYFISVMSKNSTHPDIGKYTNMELAYAIKHEFLKKNKIIPVLIKAQKPDELLGPYKALGNVKYVEFDLLETKSFFSAIAQLCRRFKIIYYPVFIEHPKFPFWKFFREEVFNLAQSNATHIHLMIMISEFIEKVKHDRWEDAYFLITHFINSSKYEIPDYQIFYPWIVKAVCEQELNLLDAAEKSYLYANQIKPNNENVYGGLGSVYVQRGNLAKAKEYFKKSLEFCPKGENEDEKFNYAVTLINLNEKIPKELQNFILEINPESFTDEARLNIWNAKAALYYNLHHFQEVVAIYDKLYDLIELDTPAVVRYYLSLINLNYSNRAESVLLSAINKKNQSKSIDPGILYHYLADFHLRKDETNKALAIYEQHLIKLPLRTRQFIIKYARLFKYQGKIQKMREICSNLLSGALFPLPTKEEDFYYDGFAQYLLGNMEKALYDYERSNKFDKYYSEYEF